MQYILFMLVLMFGVFVQALAGFGGTLIAMPLGIMIMGMGVTKPVMTFVAWITGIIVVVQEYKHINTRELMKMVGVMLVGVLSGIWLTGRLQLNFLLILYGIMVAGIGVKRLFFKQKKEPSPLVQNTALAVAGIMQGLFVSGGSFLAVYSVAKIKEKQQFRATVNAVWAIINTIMIITYFIDGSVTKEVLTSSGIAIIPTLVTVWLGGVLTKRVKQETFLKIIYVVLIVSGAVLFVTNI